MKKGFTLAEVLITLGVIGVVAAITLPILIHKYQMKIYETAFKKEYAKLENALEYISIEDGINKCYISWVGSGGYKVIGSECVQLRNELIQKLSLSQLNKTIKYKDKNYILANGTIVNNSAGFITNYYYWYRAKNGVLYNFYNLPYLAIDINGEAKPNKWGYDIFLMNLTPVKSANRIIVTDRLQGAKEKGGVLIRQILNPKDTSTDYKRDDGGF